MSRMLVVFLIFQVFLVEAQTSLQDFFRPMPPVSPLVSQGIWGEQNVLPRDTSNGLEDPQLDDWCYWDGSVIKDDQGRYHMYASRWPQSVSHREGWQENSKGIHAVSNNIMGPYEDKGLAYPSWQGGLGSNVMGLRMHDGRYAVVSSEVTPGNVFVSDTPDGPFTHLGEITYEANGFSLGYARYNNPPNHMSNVRIILRHDGRYMIIARLTAPMVSDNGILGPYKIMNHPVYHEYPGIPQDRNEDPTVWYSGGMYHVVFNHWPTGTSYHFTSFDGINDWKYRGIAFQKGDPDKNIFKYTNGVENEWVVIERPTAIMENGHVTHFHFSVLDTGKGGDQANDNNGSKIVVVPFDGVAFDEWMQEVVANDSQEEQNLALNKTATQSSEYNANFPASKAVNGTTGDFSSTGLDANAWWEVDLGAVSDITSIEVYNRVNCCQDRLSNFHVFVSDVPFNSTNLNTTKNQSGVGNFYTNGQAASPTTLNANRTGRYVRVQLAGTSYLHPAEIVVNGTPRTVNVTNIALNKNATQSSEYSANFPASKSVNGTTGDFSSTGLDANAWWQVDLGSVSDISRIEVWNRQNCCQDRLSAYHVLVSDQPFNSTNLNTTINQSGVSNYYNGGTAGFPSTVNVNRTGRYVRVQLSGTSYLHPAEINVIGTSGNRVAASSLASDQIKLEKEVVVFPNPFTDELRIEGEYDQVEIVNMNGKILFSEKTIDDQQDLIIRPPYEKVPRGIYVLRLINGSSVEKVKLIRG